MDFDDVQIRPAVVQDIPTVLAMKRRLTELQESDGVDYELYYQSILRNGLFLVAVSGGQVVGYIAVEMDGAICYVADSAVLESVRETGIFTMLFKTFANNLQARADELRARGITTVTLLCHVKASNNVMMKILEKSFGMRPVGNYVLFSKVYDEHTLI